VPVLARVAAIFFADVTGFTHASHNNAAGAVEYELAGFIEFMIDASAQGAYGVRFYAKGAKP
jgi:class 3 adenylate cyclase